MYCEELRRQKYRQFNVLLNHLGIRKNKYDLLDGYSVESTKDLSDEELDNLIMRLQGMLHNRFDADLETKRWRSNVLTLCNKYGIYATNNDWERINKFLMNPKIAGKLLYEMNIGEMKALCTKLRKIIKKQEAKVGREKQLAKLN